MAKRMYRLCVKKNSCPKVGRSVLPPVVIFSLQIDGQMLFLQTGTSFERLLCFKPDHTVFFAYLVLIGRFTSSPPEFHGE